MPRRFYFQRTVSAFSGNDCGNDAGVWYPINTLDGNRHLADSKSIDASETECTIGGAFDSGITITAPALSGAYNGGGIHTWISTGSTRPNGTFGGNVRGVVKAQMNWDADDSPSRSVDGWLALYIKIVDNQSTPVTRGVLYDGTQIRHGGSPIDTTNEFVIGGPNGDLTSGGQTRLIRQSSSMNTAINLTSCSFQTGDRLVVQLGWILFGTGTTTNNSFRKWRGCPPTVADYAETEGNEAHGVSWIEFSEDWFTEPTESVATGSSGTVCPDLSSSIQSISAQNQNDYDIMKGSTALFQYNNSDGCQIQAPFIYGVRGSRSLRTSYSPYTCVQSTISKDITTGSI